VEEADMWFMSKLKAETSVNMLLPAIITIIGLIVLYVFFGRLAAFAYVAIILFLYALFSFSAFIRTRNTGYLIASLFQLCACFWIGGAHNGILFISEQIITLCQLGALFFMLWMQTLLLTRRFKWRGREIFELAALPVEETTNGFTERPRPLKNTEATREDTLKFADFIASHLIAMPYIEADRVVFVPVTMAQSFRHLYPWSHNYPNDTWISIDNRGQVSVNIARAEYLKYKDSLSFDQLCQSLGELFIEFMEMFKRGDGVRVIDRLNSLRINPYT